VIFLEDSRRCRSGARNFLCLTSTALITLYHSHKCQPPLSGTISQSDKRSRSPDIQYFTIPQPTDHEWISFATTPNAESILLRRSDTFTWETSDLHLSVDDERTAYWTGNYWLAVGTDQFNKYAVFKECRCVLNWVDFSGPLRGRPRHRSWMERIDLGGNGS
jgi:hypothetical protein